MNWMRWGLLPLALLAAAHSAADGDPPKPSRVTSRDWQKVATGGETGCASGTPYGFFHRDGSDPNRLLIYFEGGGACWDWVSCSGLFDSSVADDELSEFRGIFDSARGDNPFRGYPIVFVPYCTGDVHVGDATRRYGDNPSSRPIMHRGYQNVRAVLDWVAGQRWHPHVVVIAGTSAGSYAALFYAPVVERQFPQARVVVLGDSGVPLLADNREVLHEWGADDVLRGIWSEDPAMDEPRDPLVEAYRQAARTDGKVRLAQITSDRDAVQGAFYLVSGSPGWREATYGLLAEAQKVVPSFRSFIVEGSDHGLLPTDAFYTYESDGVYLKDWVERLIDGDPVEDVRCTDCTLN